MRFHGREIDPVALWDRYVEFPHNMDREDMFSPLVMCPNPAHDNFKSPAFQINLKEPLVHCFSRCGIEGTYVHAIALVEGLYERFHVHEAMTKREELARSNRARREAKKIILRGATGISRRPHQQRTTIQRPKTIVLDYEHFLPPVAVEYLRKRGIDESAISFWQVGWDKDEKRIVIPALDENGKLKFLIKRAVLPTQNPKYLYSQDAQKTGILFGAESMESRSTVVLMRASSPSSSGGLRYCTSISSTSSSPTSWSRSSG
jgi:DNA primase